MTLEPQKAHINKEKAASEERQHQTKDSQQQVQSEVEEITKKRTKTKKTAQQQHQAQPEVALPGLNETLAPVEPDGEGDVRGRRKANEFSLVIADATMEYIGDGRGPDYLPRVQEEAYERIYTAERMLCGHIVTIGNVPPVDMKRWWRPFRVDDLWFVLEPRQGYIRDYHLMPSFGPPPDEMDDTPPQLRRQQRFPPPDYIGPRRRRRGGGAKGERPVGEPQRQPKVGGKRKRGDVKRIINERYNLAVAELEQCERVFLHSLAQSWRQTKPRLLRSLVHIKRLSRACGSRVQDWRDAAVSFVQVTPIFTPFANFRSESLTVRRDRAPETFGPSGFLELSSVGQTVSSWLRLYSWNWDQPPIPWAEYLFGVDWTLNIFGAPQEEQAFA